MRAMHVTRVFTAFFRIVEAADLQAFRPLDMVPDGWESSPADARIAIAHPSPA
jgi:hypothetical protein